MNSGKFAKAQSKGSSLIKIPPNNNNCALQKHILSLESKKIGDTVPKIRLKVNG